MNEALELLQKFLSSIPYCHQANSEGHYQHLLYVIFTLLGDYVDVEVHTGQGRIDLVIRTEKYIYLVEVKMNQDAKKAWSR